MEELNTGESWNKKRIIIALSLVAVLMLGGYFFKTQVLDTKDANLSTSKDALKSVKGINNNQKNNQAEERLNLNVQKALTEKIKGLQQEVSGLNIVEIASSSPQVQKILNDIKSLEQYPTNQAKEICRQICGL